MQSALIRTVGASMVLEAPTMSLCPESAEILPFFHDLFFCSKFNTVFLKEHVTAFLLSLQDSND